MSGKWSVVQASKIFNLSLPELFYKAQTVHRENFDAETIQISTLLSIKTGKCPENCSYCPQSIHHKTNIKSEPLMDISKVIEAAKAAKANGSTRFCMGAAWRGPTSKTLPQVCEMVKEVKKLGMETCVTLGLLKEEHAVALKDAGLDYYNHNIDTSPEYYEKIITTRTFENRIQTLEHVRNADIKVCCGGILGMGETTEDRLKMLVVLANLETQPESVPINQLMKIPGTPLEDVDDIDPFEFVRTIGVARVMMPKSYIRLSAGRENMSEELQALCFLMGVNSIFYGEKLLTSNNPAPIKDDILLDKLGYKKASLASA
ncbi:biotin synthase-like [Planococcus citri]|uniref:biotin synthase n=1 Tax=Planococcus citri TaxID=170843 RepID=S5NFX8_9HEMI|nr:biotin synthase [Planococcus citri]